VLTSGHPPETIISWVRGEGEGPPKDVQVRVGAVAIYGDQQDEEGGFSSEQGNGRVRRNGSSTWRVIKIEAGQACTVTGKIEYYYTSIT
jgi:hypothetical protein